MEERVAVCLAVASIGWSRHLDGGDVSGQEVMDTLGRAAAEASRWRAEQWGAPPLRPAELVRAMSRPMVEWLPEGEDECLMEDGEPTVWAQEYAELQGADPMLEAQQRVILKAMETLSARPDGERRYTDFREYLIRHSLALESEARAMIAPLGLALSDCYQPLAASCLDDVKSQEVCFPCPRCGWPMRIQRRCGRLSCHATACVSEGVRFMRHRERWEPVGNRHWRVEPVPAAGRVRLTPGLWRYTVLPGLWELDLAERLRRLPGVIVTLWPHLDRYDLAVEYVDRHWRVDVKDHRSPRRLAELLLRDPPTALTDIVVPDARHADLPLLRQRCGAGPWRFATCSEFVRQVRQEVGA